jgi:DNA gyrase subunit B
MANTKNNPASEYTADQLQQLDPMDHIRKRIGMYLADNSTRGMTHGLVEIIDNASDEHMAGFGADTEIILYDDGSAEVHDSGRGIPHEINKKTGKSGILLAVGSVGAGGKFGGKDSGYSTSGGLNGVGSAATNATSLRFDVTVYRDGKKHEMSFKQGKPGIWKEANNPYSAFQPSDKLKTSDDDRTAEEKKKRPTGTSIRWWPDKTVFMPDAEFDVTYIKARAKQTAFLLSGYKLTVKDLRIPSSPNVETYKYDGGITEMMDDAAPDEQLTPSILIHGTGTFTETVPQTNDEGIMVPTEVERVVEVDVVFRWGKEYDYTMKSFVNIVTTPNGGTHVKGFERAISKAITDRIKTNKMLKNNEPTPILDDIREGLTAVVSIKIPEPQFLGQDKTELTSPEANNIVYNIVLENLSNWMDNRKNLNQAKLIMQKSVNASRVRLTQKQQRETARKKNALESSSMPAKLVDCLKNAEDSNELLICEGDSALGGLRSARDSMYQALFPIRGKILNVHKATLKQVLDNAECSSIIQVVGGGVGNSFDLDAVRYKRIIFASDADADGSHIRALLITLFAKHMKQIIEDGRLYTIMPPLYKIKVGGRNPEDIYALNDEEKNKILERLEKEGKPLRAPLSRLKGLGEMQPEDLWITSLDPATRNLRKITWGDVEESHRILDLAMGSDVASRKEWIMSSRIKVDELDF